MAVTIEEFCGIMDELAPLSLAYGWDNSGLVVRASSEVNSVLIALDLTKDVIDEAVKRGADMILTHHPILFEPIRRVYDNEGDGALICALVRNGISLYCAHTSMDRAAGGINDRLCELLGLTDVERIAEEDGNAIVRVGNLPRPMDEAGLAAHVKAGLGCAGVRISGNSGPYSRLAVCGGAGTSVINDAKGAGADALLSGELKYNAHVEAAGLALVEAGHFETERCFVDIALKGLQERANKVLLNVSAVLADAGRPYRYY